MFDSFLYWLFPLEHSPRNQKNSMTARLTALQFFASPHWASIDPFLWMFLPTSTRNLKCTQIDRCMVPHFCLLIYRFPFCHHFAYIDGPTCDMDNNNNVGLMHANDRDSYRSTEQRNNNVSTNTKALLTKCLLNVINLSPIALTLGRVVMEFWLFSPRSHFYFFKNAKSFVSP